MALCQAGQRRGWIFLLGGVAISRTKCCPSLMNMPPLVSSTLSVRSAHRLLGRPSAANSARRCRLSPSRRFERRAVAVGPRQQPGRQRWRRVAGGPDCSLVNAYAQCRSNSPRALDRLVAVLDVVREGEQGQRRRPPPPWPRGARHGGVSDEALAA